MDKKKAVIILSVVAVAAMLSSVALTAYADDNSEESAVMPELPRWGRALRGGWGPSGGCFGGVEVSEEYEAKAIAIAENDGDVQELLGSGYTILGVRPIIKSIVDAEGNVETKATNAIVMLRNEETMGHASVMVDMGAESVTKIVIITRTVIDKT